MGGLGNGRRGGRAPSLIVAALIACMLVLGFNYWVTSTRNLELQTKLYELQGQVRRAAADRDEAELNNKAFQAEIEKQRKQIEHLRSLHRSEMEETLSTCSQQKIILQQNISTSSKNIQDFKGQLSQLNVDLGNLQKELQSCQGNVNTLNNKLTFDMSHCQSQVLQEKEICNQKVAATRLELQKKMEKLFPPSTAPQKVMKNEAEKENATFKSVPTEVQRLAIVKQMLISPQEKEDTNNVTAQKATDRPSVQIVSKSRSQSLPVETAVDQNNVPKEDFSKTDEPEAAPKEVLKKNVNDANDVELMETHNEQLQNQSKGPSEMGTERSKEGDPVMENMLMAQSNADGMGNDQRLDDGEEYDVEEQAAGGVELEKQEKSKNAENIDKDLEQELADYNGDDENEGEFEADKQAALAQF